MALLRLEANAVNRWRGSDASVSIEGDIAKERLFQLDKFVPEPGFESLRDMMTEASLFGYEVCESISNDFGWEWPKQLGDRVLEVFEVSTAG
jgi:hypothetical protein